MFARGNLRWGAAVIFFYVSGYSSVSAGDFIGLVTKTEHDPYFLVLKIATKAKATALGLTLE